MTKTTRKLRNNGTKSDPAKSEVTRTELAKEQPVKTRKTAAAKSEVVQPITSAPATTAPARQLTIATTSAPQPIAIKAIAPEPPAQPKPRRNVVSLELVKPEAKSVAVAGSFNEWKPERAPLTRAHDGHWVGDLNIKPGRYEYLFVVDGQWVPDPNARETVANPFGGRNSVLIVSE